MVRTLPLFTYMRDLSIINDADLWNPFLNARKASLSGQKAGYLLSQSKSRLVYFTDSQWSRK